MVEENKIMECPQCGKGITRQTTNRWCFMCIWDHGWEAYASWLEEQLSQKEVEIEKLNQEFDEFAELFVE